MPWSSNQGIVCYVSSFSHTDTFPQLSNTKHHFETLGHKLNDHMCILMHFSSNDVGDLCCWLAASLWKGANAWTICGFLESAISGLYCPQGGFTQHDFDVSFLVKALGSPHLLYAPQWSHGLSSWRTVHCHVKILKLIPSISVPDCLLPQKKQSGKDILPCFVCGESTILKDMWNHVGGHILHTFHESDAPDECTLQLIGDKSLWISCIGWLFNSTTGEKRWWYYYHIKLLIPLCSDAIQSCSKVFQVYSIN